MAILLDFDSEEEFTAFLLKTRTELLETFRKATDVSCSPPALFIHYFIMIIILFLAQQTTTHIELVLHLLPSSR